MNNSYLGEAQVIYQANPQFKAVRITNSSDTEQFIRTLYDSGTMSYREEFRIIMLNNSNHVVATALLGIGSVNATVVDKAHIVRQMILNVANCCILVHNHPSGKLEASANDLKLTREVKEVLKLLSFQVLDHLILAPLPGKYLSMADEGIL
jgi:DNA repair protein RadC